MGDIIKRTGVGSLLLILMPLVVWVLRWRWAPGGNYDIQYVLYWLTESVTRPWGILTSALLCGWFLWCLRLHFKSALVLLAIMIAVIAGGQFSNQVIKTLLKEPRPYVRWLEETHHITSEDFYAQPRDSRSVQVTQMTDHDNRIPAWLKQHWSFETGFALPSGHTMFSASWALLSVGLLWPRRHYKTVAVLMIWATGVMTSRLVLGMHWPRDLVAAVLMSWLLVIVSTWCAQRWGILAMKPREQRLIVQRKSTK
ncbi:phosphatidylglycerophosphatase B [Izhakiella capsodis]|uniref:undecaprenyl-diphosphate phosphatase n=1 Tax=Izhakiella capsodis TaxID=1367852 RepID=A0A1I4V3C1_9GAMM|nr:phosphatidylglycerophosphatase B [Izhakiella capsodis]SFM95655.1 phosphatidylglycerophosphatase B [Izhakiella capsodis]